MLESGLGTFKISYIKLNLFRSVVGRLIFFWGVVVVLYLLNVGFVVVRIVVCVFRVVVILVFAILTVCCFMILCIVV